MNRLAAADRLIIAKRRHHRGADAEALHRGGGKGTGQAEQEDADCRGKGDDAARPAKASAQGTISTPGVERSPAAASSATKITATTASA